MATTYEKTITEAQMQSFNNNFEKNIEGNVDIQNIITMVYYAKDYNKRNEIEPTDKIRYISVFLDMVDLTKKSETELTEDFLKNDKYIYANEGKDKENRQVYTCKIEYNKDGIVNKVTCQKK